MTASCTNFGKFWDGLPESNTNIAPAPLARKRVFLHTSPTVGGNLGGIAGADTTCNGSAQRPDTTVTYAAMIADGSGRRACINPSCTNPAENINWALKPNTIYLQAAGTVEIGTTNAAGILSFPLAATLSATAGFYLHGLNADWTTGSFCVGAGGNWSGTMSAGSCSGGQAGDPLNLVNSSVPCTSGTNYLLCAEQ